MVTLIKQQPVLFQGMIQAAIALLIAFGLTLSSAQVGAILALTAAILSLFTKQLVTPVANPRTNDGTRLVPATRAAGQRP